jgi:hypothetical protein
VDLTISINLDNDAFDVGKNTHELARILKLAATLALESDHAEHLDGCPLRDKNGNTVGKIRVTE